MFKRSAGLLLLVSTAAFGGETISFNNLHASYVSSDASRADGDGFAFGGSLQLTSLIHATAEFSTRTFDGENGARDFDQEFFSVGVGGNYPLSTDGKIQLFGAATWEQVDGESSGSASPPVNPDDDMGDDSGGDLCLPGDPTGLLCLPDIFGVAKNLSTAGGRLDGFGAQVGVRALVWRTLEVGGRYRFRDYDEADVTIFSLGAVYGINDSWSAGLSYDSFSGDAELDEIYASVRYTFGLAGDDSGSIW